MSEDYSNLVIDETNFDQYFFDAKKHKPKKGQVMARYTAVAYLEDGKLKRDLINMLLDGTAEAAARIMSVMGGAILSDSYRVPKEMAMDLIDGLTEEEVAAKPYKFVLEHLFWAERGVVPENDPHWYTLPVLSWGKYADDIEFSDEAILPAKDGEETFPESSDLV
jgi:hypothetical protein